MTRTTLVIALTAAAALAGCNKSAQTKAAADEANNAAAEAAPPVELPPSITASKIYRCKDNSVVYIDWLSDNVSANVRTEKNGTPSQVKTGEAGSPLTGTASAATITYNGKSCKA